MITIFNRVALTVTDSMKRQAQLRQLLSAQNIPYRIKVIHRNSPSASSDTRARTGTFGQTMALSDTYCFYVQKADFARAQAVVQQCNE